MYVYHQCSPNDLVNFYQNVGILIIFIFQDFWFNCLINSKLKASQPQVNAKSLFFQYIPHTRTWKKYYLQSKKKKTTIRWI